MPLLRRLERDGLLLRDLRLPDFRDYAIDVTAPGAVMAESTRSMGRMLRDVMRLNLEAREGRMLDRMLAQIAPLLGVRAEH